MPSTVLLFLYLSTLYLTCSDASDASVAKLSTSEIDLTSDETIAEIQHATCKIATEEIVASARATVTRVLTGSCTTKIIDEKLQALQKNLTKELEDIKSLVYRLLEGKRDSGIPEAHHLRVHREDENGVISPRQPEINRFNNTFQRILSASGASNHFYYYWRINNFNEKLIGWKTARSERSSTFYVGQNGYAMYMKITPQYFPDGTVFIGVGLTRGRHDSILKWPFPYKICLEVLDHSSEQPRGDRRSRIWDPSTLCSEYFWGRPKLTGLPDNPECVGLSIPREVFFSKLPSTIDPSSSNARYVWNGCITIKLTLYL